MYQVSESIPPLNQAVETLNLECNRVEQRVSLILAGVFGIIGCVSVTAGVFTFLGHGTVPIGYSLVPFGGSLFLISAFFILRAFENYKEIRGIEKDRFIRERVREAKPHTGRYITRKKKWTQAQRDHFLKKTAEKAKYLTHEEFWEMTEKLSDFFSGEELERMITIYLSHEEAQKNFQTLLDDA